MLEAVFEVREEVRLVDELGGLEMGQGVTQILLGRIRDRGQEREGNILADDGG